MTKKKIRYSEFPAAGAPLPAAPAAPPVPAAPAPAAERAGDAAVESVPVKRPAPPRDARPSAARRPAAPLDLARALAAARSAEAAAAAQHAAPAAEPGLPSTPPAPVPASQRPAAGGVVVGRLTPMGGSLIVRRETPARSSVAIPREPVPAAAGEPAAPSLRERARLRRGIVELLVFAVGGEWFGVELARVEEAVDLTTVRHIPEMPPAMIGVTTFRDALTPVFGPEGALGLAPGGRSSALVFRRERGRIGIAVDDVDDVHTLDLANLKDAPGTDAADGILLGVLRYRDGLLALVDAESLITACQTVPLLETA